MASDNTLRPYYDHDSFNAGYSVIFKPGVGLIDTTTNKPITSSLASSVASQTPNRLFAPGGGIGISGFSRSTQITDFGSNASDKNYVYDLEFQEYFDFNNLSELLKNLVWNFCKNYFKVVLSQPLEAVRLVLQVGYFDFSQSAKQPKKDAEKPASSRKYSRLLNDSPSTTPLQTDISETDSEGEIDYFQSSSQPTVRSQSLDPRKPASIHKGKRSKHLLNPNKIDPVSKHTIDIMTAIATKDGPFALFRGINASFIHQTLSHTIEAWITGFISPFLGIPDPFFLDLTHLTEPLKSLWLSVLACVLTGLILMPLDLIKVRLMITQFNRPPAAEDADTPSGSGPEDVAPSPDTKAVNTRSVRESVRNYPLKFLLHPPPTIALLTVLHQFSTTVFRKTAPYLMFVRFNVDSYLSPNLYTLFNLVLLITEFFIKLPVENLLRKEQVRFLLSPKTAEEDPMRVVTIENPDEDLIVTFNSWDAEALLDNDLRDEVDTSKQPAGYVQKIAKLGLFDGWRVGVLNVIGFWGYNILKSDSTAMKAERL